MPIKRGDRIVVKVHGVEVPAEAASDEADGSIQIKRKGTFSTVEVADVCCVDTDAFPVSGVVPDVAKGTPICPQCGRPGRSVLPNQADVIRRVLVADFRCDNSHQWQKEYPLR